MFSASEPVSDIALVAAVFPVVVAICCELFVAIRAFKMIDSLEFQLVAVHPPPFHAAVIGAEFLLFPLGVLPDRKPAPLAGVYLIINALLCFSPAAQTVPSALRLYGALGHVEQIRYPPVAVTLCA